MKTSLSAALVAGIFLSETSVAEETVTLPNFIRAETDGYFEVAAKAGVGVWSHRRTPLQLDEQDVIRLNRDTLYSNALLDLSTPATITLPDAGDRFMSMLVINEDHFVKLIAYDPGDYELTQEMIGTRYAQVMIRTFVNPNDPADIQAAHALQDSLAITQADPGVADFPDWNVAQRDEIRHLLNQLAPYADQSLAGFGDEGEVDPVNHLIFTAAGWGGNPRDAAVYVSRVPENADGTTAYSLTLRDVPVDGFWSITVYTKMVSWRPRSNRLPSITLRQIRTPMARSPSISAEIPASQTTCTSCRDGTTRFASIAPGQKFLTGLDRARLVFAAMTRIVCSRLIGRTKGGLIT